MADGSIKLGLDVTTDANQIKAEATKVGDILSDNISKNATKRADAFNTSTKKLVDTMSKLGSAELRTDNIQADMDRVGSSAQRVSRTVSDAFATALSGIINFSNDAGGRLNDFAVNSLGRVITFCNDAGAKLAEVSSKSSFVSIFERLMGLKMESPVPQDAPSALDNMASSVLRLNNVYQDILGTQDSIRDRFSKELVSQEDLKSLDGLVASIEEVKGQIESLQKLLDKAPAHNKLVAQFAALSDAEKVSPMGQQMQAQIDAFDKAVDILKTKLTATFGTGRGSQYTAIGSTWTDNTVNELKKVLTELQHAKSEIETEIYDNAQSKFGDFSVMVTHLRQAKAELSAMDSGKVAFTDEDYTAKAAEVQILTRAVQGLRASMQESINSKVAQDIANLEAKATELEAKKASLGTGADKSELQAIDTQLSSVKEKLQLLRGAKAEPIVNMTVTNQALADAIAKVDELSEKVKLARAQGANESMAGFNNLTKELASATKQAELLSTLLNNPQKAFQSLTGVASQFANLMQRGTAKINSGLSKLVGLAGRAASAMVKLAKSTTASSTEMQRGFKRGLKYLLMMVFGVRGLMFAFRRLRTVVISTIQEMAKSSSEFSDQISEFKTLLNTLKGSLGTMAQPLISAVLPAVNAIIQALTEAIILVAKFFAVLSGQGYILKATGAQVDYAKSLKGTGGAAKEAQKALMGFDELNRLNADNAGGGGGGGTPDFTYEKMALDQDDAVSRFAEMVKRAWQTGDFFDVGHFLAEKAKGWLETFNGWLLTTGQSYAQRIARSFATLINGIVSPDVGLSRTIGETFANLGNVILGAINTFLVTTNWSDVGTFIGNAIMSAIMHFNWNQLGETVAHWISAGIMAWRGFLDSNFDFSTLGERIGESINSFFRTMGEVDPNTGRTMWQTLGRNLSDTATGLLDAIISALEEVDWNEVGVAIGEFLGSIDWRGILDGIVTIIGDVLGGIWDILSGWGEADSGSLTFVGVVAGIMALVGALGTLSGAIVSILPVIGWFVANWAVVAPLLGTVLGAIVSVACAILPWVVVIGILIGAIALLTYAIREHGDTIRDVIVIGFTTLVDWVTDGCEAFVGWWTPFWEGVKDFCTNVVTAIVDFIGDRIDMFKALVQAGLTFIQSFITARLHGILSFITSILNIVVSTVQGKINMVISVFEGMRDVLNSIWGGLGDMFASGMNVALGVVDSFVNGIINAINGVVNAFNSLSVNIPDSVRAVASAITGTDIPSSISFNVPTIPNVSVPRLANGAVLPPNKPFAAIVGDQKSGTNVEAPLETIKLAVAEEMGEVKNVIVAGFDALIRTVEEKDVDVHIGDRAIGQAANRYNKKVNIMKGSAT